MARRIVFVCGEETAGYSALHHALRLLRNFRLWQMLKLRHVGEKVGRPGLSEEDSGVRKQVIDTDPSLAIDLFKVKRSSAACR